jgi:hypothetical protein
MDGDFGVARIRAIGWSRHRVVPAVVSWHHLLVATQSFFHTNQRRQRQDVRVTAPSDNRDISTSSIVVAAKDQVSSDLAGETVLLSMQSAMYYGLDQVGSRIWELVREPIRVSDLRDAITREYDVEPERCEADVLGFLRELAVKGLIEVRDGR